MQTLKYNKKLMKAINIIVAVILIIDGSFFGWPEVFKNPYFFPQIETAEAAIGTQHNWAWGLDQSSTPVMGTRSNTSNDGPISIKVGSVVGSDTDPILRLQIVNTAAITSGDKIELYVTDCTDIVLKTCATRSIGANTTTAWVSIDDQDGTTTGIFRFREASNASFVNGSQISIVVGVTEHNPTQGAYVEGTTSVASSTADFTSATYSASDFSFVYYGEAPLVKKTYMFAMGYNGVLPGWSGMHGSYGAVLDLLPANWVGSQLVSAGVSITSGTTATTTMMFDDDSNTNSSTTIGYSLTESGTFTLPAACIAMTGGQNMMLNQDGSYSHMRICDITGLTANKIYFFKVYHTDPDGLAGSETQILGPYYTNMGQGSIHIHADSFDVFSSTTEDVGEIKENDGGTYATAQAALDGQMTLVRTTGRFQIEEWTPMLDSNMTLNSTELRWKFGISAGQDAAQKLYRSSPGAEPLLCAANGTGGTNWQLVSDMPTTPTGDWFAETASTTLTGYSIAQLATMDMCLSNTNSSGSAASDVIAFDFITILPIFTPPSSGSGSPTTTSKAATFVSSTGAQLNAVMNTQGISGKAYFEYGTTESYGSYSSSTLGATGEFIFNSIGGHSIMSGNFFPRITGLSAGTLYHYRSCLRAPPTATAVCGSDMTFTTDAANVSFTQNIYRWYTDSDALDVTNAWGNTDIAANTAITVLPYGNLAPTTTMELRLRMNFTLSGADDMSASAKQFKLQYKQGTDSTCTTGSWTDVGAQNSAVPWRFANSSVQSPNLATTRLSPASDVMELYVTSTPSGLNPNSATAGQEIEYDFHIQNYSATSTARYSFRAVESDDTVFDAYTNCPTLTTGPDMPTFMRHGNSLTDGLETGFYWAD